LEFESVVAVGFLAACVVGFLVWDMRRMAKSAQIEARTKRPFPAVPYDERAEAEKRRLGGE